MPSEDRIPLAAQKGGAYRVPRRFGLGTIFVVTSLFCVMFALLRALGAPPAVMIFLGGFFFFIGAMQLVLGRVPRVASIVAGSLFMVLANFIMSFYDQVPIRNNIDTVLTLLIVGAILGYLGGTLVAGVFLVIDKAEQAIRAKRASSADQQAPQPPADFSEE